jgi:hypothetical protein
MNHPLALAFALALVTACGGGPSHPGMLTDEQPSGARQSAQVEDVDPTPGAPTVLGANFADPPSGSLENLTLNGALEVPGVVHAWSMNFAAAEIATAGAIADAINASSAGEWISASTEDGHIRITGNATGPDTFLYVYPSTAQEILGFDANLVAQGTSTGEEPAPEPCVENTVTSAPTVLSALSVDPPSASLTGLTLEGTLERNATTIRWTVPFREREDWTGQDVVDAFAATVAGEMITASLEDGHLRLTANDMAGAGTFLRVNEGAAADILGFSEDAPGEGSSETETVCPGE